MKTWAAKQLVLDIARPMLHVIKSQKWSNRASADLLACTSRVKGVPFYFDSHNNCQITPRDIGFGLYTLRNDIETHGTTRPLLELAAFLGIQRFRPTPIREKKLLRFTLWQVPRSSRSRKCGRFRPVAFAQ